MDWGKLGCFTIAGLLALLVLAFIALPGLDFGDEADRVIGDVKDTYDDIQNSETVQNAEEAGQELQNIAQETEQELEQWTNEYIDGEDPNAPTTTIQEVVGGAVNDYTSEVEGNFTDFERQLADGVGCALSDPRCAAEVNKASETLTNGDGILEGVIREAQLNLNLDPTAP